METRITPRAQRVRNAEALARLIANELGLPFTREDLTPTTASISFVKGPGLLLRFRACGYLPSIDESNAPRMYTRLLDLLDGIRGSRYARQAGHTMGGAR